MTTTGKTRYIAIRVRGNSQTQEMAKTDALHALADGDADCVIVTQWAADGTVSIIKWELTESAP